MRGHGAETLQRAPHTLWCSYSSAGATDVGDRRHARRRSGTRAVRVRRASGQRDLTPRAGMYLCRVTGSVCTRRGRDVDGSRVVLITRAGDASGAERSAARVLSIGEDGRHTDEIPPPVSGKRRSPPIRRLSYSRSFCALALVLVKRERRMRVGGVRMRRCANELGPTSTSTGREGWPWAYGPRLRAPPWYLSAPSVSSAPAACLRAVGGATCLAHLVPQVIPSSALSIFRLLLVLSSRLIVSQLVYVLTPSFSSPSQELRERPHFDYMRVLCPACLPLPLS